MTAYPNYLTLDTETSGATNDTFGNPFTDSNRLCYIGIGNSSRATSWEVDTGRVAYGPILTDVSECLQGVGLLVGFNIKFDLHWLRRYGLNVGHIPVWDCQLAHFIIHNQKDPLPSLEDVVNYYNLGEKYVSIEDLYWKQGIDTPDIPPEVVRMRVESDVVLTSKVFELQVDYLRANPSKKNLIWLACQDVRVLAEMEWNGLKYDIEKSLELGNQQRQKQLEIEEELCNIVGIRNINWGSDDHLSAVLYGGLLKFDIQEDYVFHYKDGRTAPKKRWKTVELQLPQRIQPLPRTELAKSGYWSTSKKVLPKLRPKDAETRRLIHLIQERNKIDKQVGTYYHGLPQLYKDMGWTDNIIHGQLTPAITATGRLSSSKPNQQNMDHKIRECIVSRFQ